MKKPIPILLAALCLGGCSEQTQYHRDYLARVAEATTPDQRRYAELEYRLMHAADHGKLLASFRIEDGVDEFEAWLVARLYALKDIGACSDIGLPSRRGSDWVIPTFVGRHGQGGPPIIIDSSTGRTTREGDISLDRPTDYISRFEARFRKTPNKALEPTPTSVTSPAAQEPRQP